MPKANEKAAPKPVDPVGANAPIDDRVKFLASEVEKIKDVLNKAFPDCLECIVPVMKDMPHSTKKAID